MASELTAAQEREYVESKWENIATGAKALHLSDYCAVIVIRGHEFANWHAAFLFTQERERQIAELEEQRRVQDGFMSICASTDRETMKRTTALLQRELAQAKQGMK
jgi:hypothetical protein